MNKQEWVALLEKHFKQASIEFIKEAITLEVIPLADAYVAASPNKIDDAAWELAKVAILKALDGLK